MLTTGKRSPWYHIYAATFLTSLLLFAFVFSGKSKPEVGGLAVLGASAAARDGGKGKTPELRRSF